MGDAADYYDESNIEAYSRHQMGYCEHGCPYCSEELDAEEEEDRREIKQRSWTPKRKKIGARSSNSGENTVIFQRGDIIEPKLHRGEPRCRCVVERISVSGRVVVRGRGGRRLTLRAYQVVLVKRKA